MTPKWRALNESQRILICMWKVVCLPKVAKYSKFHSEREYSVICMGKIPDLTTGLCRKHTMVFKPWYLKDAIWSPSLRISINDWWIQGWRNRWGISDSADADVTVQLGISFNLNTLVHIKTRHVKSECRSCFLILTNIPLSHFEY